MYTVSGKMCSSYDSWQQLGTQPGHQSRASTFCHNVSLFSLILSCIPAACFHFYHLRSLPHKGQMKTLFHPSGCSLFISQQQLCCVSTLFLWPVPASPTVVSAPVSSLTSAPVSPPTCILGKCLTDARTYMSSLTVPNFLVLELCVSFLQMNEVCFPLAASG